ncbi:MAG TPA: hypothetical protein VET87_24825 [Rubrivivax sp.]|jgi:hypothetical protein|nr:hypothetical protein [Rubrivivax sp.]
MAYFLPAGIGGGFHGQAQVAAGENVNGKWLFRASYGRVDSSRTYPGNVEGQKAERSASDTYSEERARAGAFADLVPPPGS